MPGCEALTASRSCCCAVLKQDCPRLSNSSHDVGAMEKKLTIRPPTVAEYEGDARVGVETAGPRGDGARPHGASAMVGGQFPVVFRFAATPDARMKHKL